MAVPETISTKELGNRWKAHANHEFGWAFYRFPGDSEVNFLGGSVFSSSNDKISGNGFIVAPFYSPDNQLYCIENVLQYRLTDNSLSELFVNFKFHYGEIKKTNITTKDGYEKLVSDTLSEIGKGNMQKAVPARIKLVNLEAGFAPFRLYESLLKAYPNAFVYMLSTPQTGTWIGCTPEKLLQVNDTEINTMSLAGTKKTIGGDDENFSSKETEEQAIVTRYIHSILENFSTDIKADGPHITKAGNVSHLATYFKGELKPEYLNNYMPILKDLHPTPAVCGIPLNTVRDFLLQNEGFDRSLYSGFLGPISESKADIFVNLRCMQVFNDSAFLYAGAGVVAGSIPEKEWFETEEKMNTLLRFL